MRTPEPVDLYDLVRRDLGNLPDTGYTAPGEEVRAALRSGLDRVLAHDWQAADDALRARGYAGTVHGDVPSGTAFGRVAPLAHPHAGWGSAYALGEGTSVAIHVPHPVCEPGVERLGVEVARGVRDSVLLVAGAKRFAGGPEAGCSHPGKEPLPTDCQAASDPWVCETTVFHAWSEYLRGRSMPAVSLVGLGPHAAVADVEVDVPEGAGSSLGEAIAASVEQAGFPVCRSWADTCPAAEEGSRSRQALAYKAAGTGGPKSFDGTPDVPYVAVQVRQSVLDDAEEAAQVAKAVAAALVTAPLTSRQ
ncbi:hypothetical protein [Yinghuangia sp. YIM S09857]|uniref:hypothetical protein n=1 Tax=Yinghuangia sp. YIM S09857 TaxID=3436929 RepID=UPI003F53142D